MLNKKNRIRVAITMASTSLLIIISIFIFLKFGFYNNKVVALVNNERIYENEVKDELLEMFPNSDPRTFQIEKLPPSVLKLIAKGVFIKKEIYKNAKHAMVDKDKIVKEEIDRYSRKFISEYYLNSIIDKKITKRALNEKYAELSDQVKEGGKEYKISAILVNTEAEAQNIISKLNAKEPFNELIFQYSLNKESEDGDLGYFTLKNIREEFSVVDSMKKNEISQPIETKEGWYIIKLTDVKSLELQDFSIMEDKLIEEIKKEEINQIFSKITKNLKIKILI